jgi:hypothetical protein
MKYTLKEKEREKKKRVVSLFFAELLKAEKFFGKRVWWLG